MVMESTGDYWKGVYFLLEAEGFQCWLVNARDVKNTPGRAKTDKLDAVWLAKVAERGMCSPSLVYPPRDPAVAGLDPVPSCAGRRPHPGAATGGEAVGGRPGQDRYGAVRPSTGCPGGR